MGRLTWLQSLRCIRLTLWDVQAGRLISFREFSGRLVRSRNALQ